VSASPGRIRIGTRGSALALWQARHVQSRLATLGHEATLHTITTTGDRVLDVRLEAVGGKGAFLKEIEEALLGETVDLAVHSLKDVPTQLPDGLVLCAFLERADARDALVTNGPRLAELPPGATVGTTSLRRRALVADARPDLELRDLRGNVDTRLGRLRERRYDAILLAAAGLSRLGREGEATELLDPRRFVPAPGQGAIALECREDDSAVRDAVAALHDAVTARAVSAERALLSALGGGCNVPLGAHAVAAGSGLELVAFVAAPDGRGLLRGERRGSDPEALGRALADEMIAQGARILIGS
jgi:hydroxymethylbilane synthase